MNSTEEETRKLQSSAIKLQSAFRGFLVRRKLKKELSSLLDENEGKHYKGSMFEVVLFFN